MSWRVRALVRDKKRTCKVVHSTSVRKPVGCFELLIDVDKTPAQPVSGKQHLRFLHGIGALLRMLLYVQHLVSWDPEVCVGETRHEPDAVLM